MKEIIRETPSDSCIGHLVLQFPETAPDSLLLREQIREILCQELREQIRKIPEKGADTP